MFRKARSAVIALTIVVTSFTSAAQISANAFVSGPVTATTFVANVYPTTEFIGNGSKIWFAVIHEGVLYFNGPTGFVPYQGGDAMPLMGISSGVETIRFTDWNTSSNAGDQVYIGYGTSLTDMAENSRFSLVHTFAPAGTGNTGPATMSLAPTSLVFSSQNAGTKSVAKPLILKNTSTNTLLISSIAANGEFSLETNCGSALAAGATCIVNVSFKPTSQGIKNGSVVVSSINANTYTLSLSGTGVYTPPVTVCTLTASPSTIRIGGTSTLTVRCVPFVGSFNWSAGSCSGVTGNTCTVSPAVTTTYAAGEDSVTNTLCIVSGTIDGDFSRCSVSGKATVTVIP